MSGSYYFLDQAILIELATLPPRQAVTPRELAARLNAVLGKNVLTAAALANHLGRQVRSHPAYVAYARRLKLCDDPEVRFVHDWVERSPHSHKPLRPRGGRVRSQHEPEPQD